MIVLTCMLFANQISDTVRNSQENLQIDVHSARIVCATYQSSYFALPCMLYISLILVDKHIAKCFTTTISDRHDPASFLCSFATFLALSYESCPWNQTCSEVRWMKKLYSHLVACSRLKLAKHSWESPPSLSGTHFWYKSDPALFSVWFC